MRRFRLTRHWAALQAVAGAKPRVVMAGLCLALIQFSQPGFALTKRKFDFVVGVNGDFKAAMAAAAGGASAASRFVIFFPDGEYNIGALTGNANQMTTFTTSNVSLIGQSEDKTVVFNKSQQEGISISATLYFNKANDIYLQDLSIMNRANYGNAATYNETGRHVAVMEQGNKFIYKNARLLSTQDTYYTKGTRTYWEKGQIHGTTDFICGDGDVFFNGVLLYEMKKSAMTAPSTSTDWGYVFKDCIIDGDVGEFTLGRSWNNARAVFLNTTMKKLPSAAGWGDPMNSNPVVFGEYKSVTSTGALVDLSKRRKSYTLEGTVTLNPVLSDAEAAKYTIVNVLGGGDGWQPQNLAKQVPAPVVSQNGAKLSWGDNPDALCWVVFKNGKYTANVAVNGYDASSAAVGDLFTVRAANAMGGLGAASNAVKVGPATGLAGRDVPGARRPSRQNPVLFPGGFASSPGGADVRDAKGRRALERRAAEAVKP
jgi:pectin methylesterase-like acyl-CoA thioesterase